MIKRLLYLILVCLIATSGCVAEPEEEALPEATPTPAPTETSYSPRPGGSLSLMMRKPLTLNPILNEDVTVDRILKLVFEPLFTYDETLKPTPNIASDIELSPDGKSMIIGLKKNVFWDDGVRLTSEDLLFTLETIREAPEGSFYKTAVSNIAGFESLDSSKVRIDFYEPCFNGIYDLCFPLIPKHYYEGQQDPGSIINMTPVGNGFYRFQSLDDIKIMKLVKNTGCFKGEPLIDGVDVLISPYSDTELTAFEQEVIDAIPAELSEWGKYRGSNETAINDYMSMGFDFIGINHNNSLFNSLNIRKAIAHSINVDEMVNSIYLGHAVKSETPLNPQAWFYNRDMIGYDFNLEKAKLLIGMEGFMDWDEDGILEKESEAGTNKFSFTLLINEENVEREKIATLIKDNLAKLNIECFIESLPFEEYEIKIKMRDYDMFLGGFNLSVKPELDFAFNSSRAAGGTNYFEYRNEIMDSHLHAIATAANELSYKNALNDLQIYMKEELPCIGLVFRKSALLTSRDIKGDVKPDIYNVFANINEWFLVRE